jgi:uncharacterized membrane protein (DUF106 family)
MALLILILTFLLVFFIICAALTFPVTTWILIGAIIFSIIAKIRLVIINKEKETEKVETVKPAAKELTKKEIEKQAKEENKRILEELKKETKRLKNS